MVYGIVKQHQGWINAYSEPGQGTVFKVYLPISEEPEEEAEETVLRETFRGSGERILVVEDEVGVRSLVAKVLDGNGYVVLEAASGEEALELFEREQGNLDVVFSDMVLSDSTGLELVEELLARKGELRVLLGSGYMDDKSQWPVLRERGFRYLQKPYALPELLRTLREVIETG